MDRETLGIISDTHDNLSATGEAFRLFQRLGVPLVLHLGDIISPFVVGVMRDEYRGEIIAVFGNNDGDRLLLKEKFQAAGAEIHRAPKELVVSRRKIVMMHEPLCVESLARSGDFDLVAYGHLHEVRLERIGRTLLINPGAASGYLTGKRTLAIVRLKTMEGEIREF